MEKYTNLCYIIWYCTVGLCSLVYLSEETNRYLLLFGTSRLWPLTRKSISLRIMQLTMINLYPINMCFADFSSHSLHLSISCDSCTRCSDVWTVYIYTMIDWFTLPDIQIYYQEKWLFFVNERKSWEWAPWISHELFISNCATGQKWRTIKGVWRIDAQAQWLGNFWA